MSDRAKPENLDQRPSADYENGHCNGIMWAIAWLRHEKQGDLADRLAAHVTNQSFGKAS